jgi:ribosomal protein L13
MYAPHMDTGDHVIVINADKVELTGGKATQKYAYHHSGYPGGLRAVRYDELLAERPVAAVQKAVRGMLPKNRLGRQMIKKLHVVAGPEHPHSAQKPVELGVGERPAWGGLPKPAPAAVPTGAPKGAVAEDAAPDAKGTTARKPTVAKKPTAAKTVEVTEPTEAPAETDTTEE